MPEHAHSFIVLSFSLVLVWYQVTLLCLPYSALVTLTCRLDLQKFVSMKRLVSLVYIVYWKLCKSGLFYLFVLWFIWNHFMIDDSVRQSDRKKNIWKIRAFSIISEKGHFFKKKVHLKFLHALFNLFSRYFASKQSVV